MTTAGIINAIGSLDPYKRTEAETMAWESGVETEKCADGGIDITDIHNGDFIKIKNVKFNHKKASFMANVASASNGGTIEIHLDSLSGPLLGECKVSATGGWQKWVSQSCKMDKAKGNHDLYLVFKGGEGALLNFNWWKIVRL